MALARLISCKLSVTSCKDLCYSLYLMDEMPLCLVPHSRLAMMQQGDIGWKHPLLNGWSIATVVTCPFSVMMALAAVLLDVEQSIIELSLLPQ